MSQKNELQTTRIVSAALGKRVLLGAGLAFALIVIFLVPVRDPRPEWPMLWWLRPLIVVPLAGAVGGAFYHLMDYLSPQGGWRKALAVTASMIVYVIGLWMGTVLGLAGTLWH